MKSTEDSNLLHHKKKGEDYEANENRFSRLVHDL